MKYSVVATVETTKGIRIYKKYIVDAISDNDAETKTIKFVNEDFAEYFNLELHIANSCMHCKWCDLNCICVVCEDGQVVLCNIHRKHVDKHYICEDFSKQ